MQAWLLQSGGGGRYDQTVTEVDLKGDRGVEERRVVQPRECRPHSNPGEDGGEMEPDCTAFGR